MKQRYKQSDVKAKRLVPTGGFTAGSPEEVAFKQGLERCGGLAGQRDERKA